MRRAKTDPSTKTHLRLREIHGNVTVTPDVLTAWYVLGPQRWSFRTEAQREALIVSFASRLAALAGHRVHLRVTTRPYPAAEWAAALHHNTPHPLPGWTDHLVTAQRALQSATLSDKEVYLGIDLQRKRPRRDRAGTAVAYHDGAAAEVAKHGGLLRRLRDIVSGPGMDGHPASLAEMEWLLHRSIRLGLPAPVRLSTDQSTPWGPDDVHALTDNVRYTSKPFAPTVQVTAAYPDRDVTRHVAVLSVGRMGALTIPQSGTDPWMQHTDRIGFPVEWSSTFDVLAGPEAAQDTARKRLAIQDMQGHYAEHGMREPLDLSRKAEHAMRIEDETTEGEPVIAARCYGWHRLAVSAPTEEECLKQVQDVIDSYTGQRITMQHPRHLTDAAAQYDLLQEFTPGQPVATSAYKRRLPVLYMAAALPHVSASVGDRRGPHMGRTAGTSQRAFMLDPHYATEIREKAGLIPIVGEPGAGKSGLIGKMAYESVKRGITTTLLDPSGPLAALTLMDDLRAHSRHLDLVSGEDGVLNPYAVIGEPLQVNYRDEEEYAEALQVARQDRRMLCLDVVRGLLPAQVLEMASTPLMLGDAIRQVGGEPTASLWDVVTALEARSDGDRHATNLANFLRDMAGMPQSRLFFPNHLRDQEPVSSDTLLVLTMNGLQLPAEDQDRRNWSTSEQIAVPLLHLASHYATKRAYGLSRSERKMIGLDEAGMVGRWGSGRALFTNLGRDTRKWNIAALVASQNPADVLGLNIANWISTSFVGRIEDDETAAQALRLLRITPGAGYEAVLGGLSPQVALGDGRTRRGAREFIVKDVDGAVEKVRIELDHQPGLLTALETTAAPVSQRERVNA